MTEKLDELKQLVVTGDREKKAPDMVRELLDEGEKVDKILNDALIPAMELAGQRFEEKEFFVPELIIAARAMDRSIEVIRPLLEKSGISKRGTLVLGTVKGDQHDIGKNLAKMMFKGAGFEVIDLGHDVSVEKFVDAVMENSADVVGMSALLTTTMIQMGDVVKRLDEVGWRDKTIVIIGGAPVSREYADKIGADIYAATAPGGVELVKERLKAS